MTSPATPSASSSLSRGGVPITFEAFFVLLVPLVDELVRVASRAHHRCPHLLSLRGVVVEALAVLRVEVVAVVLAGKPRVRVGRDHEIALIHQGFDSSPERAPVRAGISALLMD